ncbi:MULTISPECIES: Isoquinoline 1-oxidoreductase subunit [unclassified Sinorhizobium]|uniref:Isoquinoline 1-oxidoreductase subunit n=1 Tax=unclassified Sinorhizobium TaxID=2613772 RepID=UPI003524C82C
MMGRAFAVSLAIGAAALGLIALGPLQGNAETTDNAAALKAVSDFDAITDTSARSKALFEEATRVITHPRCMNCHPATRSPTQGEDLHPHVPPINAIESSMGPAGLACTTCHGAENRTLVGSRLKSIPGNAHWSLAPASMAWQGLSHREICEQVKDPNRNGDRSLADLIHHMGEDHLVAWAWHPGEGRAAAPGNQEAFRALIAAWIETGAQCPD